jgi:hypothetical protein
MVAELLMELLLPAPPPPPPLLLLLVWFLPLLYVATGTRT